MRGAFASWRHHVFAREMSGIQAGGGAETKQPAKTLTEIQRPAGAPGTVEQLCVAALRSVAVLLPRAPGVGGTAGPLGSGHIASRVWSPGLVPLSFPVMFGARRRFEPHFASFKALLP